MAISKVVYNKNTLIDLTADTVTPDTLLEGVTAHNAAGEKIVGTAKPEVVEYVKMLYQVELPRSKFYGDVAEWVTTSTVDGVPDPSLQIVCNNELWIVTETGIQCRSLATKQITYSESGTYYLYGYSDLGMCGIATDGESRIWFTAYDIIANTNSKKVKTLYLYEYNVLTHTILSFEVTSKGSTSYATYSHPGVLLYSSVYNRVYVMGCGTNYNNTSYYLNWGINLSDYTVIAMEASKWGDSNRYFIANFYSYEDEEGYIYIGGGTTCSSSVSYYNSYIYRFNPYDNTLTVVRTDFNDQINSTLSDVAHFNIGDTVYIMNTTNVFAINPKTGDFIEGEMPMVLGDPLTPGKKAIHNNTVYICQNVADKTLCECTFYADSPPNAPIVAKIYEGQKFHSTVPFSLLRQGIEVTTTQQTATADIEVKMYDYSSEGGQLLYIETT